MVLPFVAGAALPEVVAHRGYWKTEGSAQNSLASITKACEIGCWGSELDVWITTDGVVVVHHDPKTSNGVMIQDVTFEQLRAQAAPLANGEQIPTLDEYLARWNHSRTKFVLEIKTHAEPQRNRAVVEECFKLLKKYKVKKSELVLIAFDWAVTKDIVSRGYGRQTQYLNGDKSPAQLKSEGVYGLDYNYKVFVENPKWVSEAHDLSMKVNVWTVDNVAKMDEMIALGVDFITTNQPVLLQEKLAAMKK